MASLRSKIITPCWCKAICEGEMGCVTVLVASINNAALDYIVCFITCNNEMKLECRHFLCVQQDIKLIN